MLSSSPSHYIIRHHHRHAIIAPRLYTSNAIERFTLGGYCSFLYLMTPRLRIITTLLPVAIAGGRLTLLLLILSLFINFDRVDYLYYIDDRCTVIYFIIISATKCLPLHCQDIIKILPSALKTTTHIFDVPTYVFPSRQTSAHFSFIDIFGSCFFHSIIAFNAWPPLRLTFDYIILDAEIYVNYIFAHYQMRTRHLSSSLFPHYHVDL